MNRPFDRILYGGDYNPNQWPRETWAEDMRFFRDAGINSATINVFSWAKIQPAEDAYDFGELDAIVEMLSGEGYDIVLATSTAALPAWMFMRYPEVGRVDYEGRRHRFGQRHNACPNSPAYRHFASELVRRLAARYGHRERVRCWHVNNEYGGECYCENCERAFRVWLRERYGTLAALNRAWNTEFWGHTIHAWDEIVVPNLLGDEMGEGKTAFAGISIDYRRFLSDSMLDNFKMERDIIRAADPDTPVTTNLMGTYKPLDYFKWAKEMDIVSWDNYPAYDTPWSRVAMTHDLMRGLKGKPFMLMEQSPSQQNWQPYNSLKKPGELRAQSFQTLAHGADTIQYFQLRRSVGGCEKFHGAVIAHSGTQNTRVYREVARIGRELAGLGDAFLGASNPARVGIVFDWENYWALEYTSGPSRDLRYVEQIHGHYAYFHARSIPVDMIPVDADFSRYDLVVAPVLYMVKAGVAQALEAFAQAGGTLVTGFMSGIVDESDNVHLGGYPGPLRRLCGVWVEEFDALEPGRTNAVRFADGTQAGCGLLCDLMHLEGAQAIAEYAGDFYAGMPAVTRNRFGRGSAYYIGTGLERSALDTVLDLAAEAAGIRPLLPEPTRLEVTCRRTDAERFYFVINLTGEAQPLPDRFAGKTDALTGERMAGRPVAPWDVRLFREKM